MVEVTEESLFSVRIGDKIYYDESNGIMSGKNGVETFQALYLNIVFGRICTATLDICEFQRKRIVI